MSRRIEIELTSARPDGTWTWRAAGAREPRGVLDGGLVYEGAKAGDVVRAEADFEIEGIVVTSVFPPKEKRREEPQRIELLARDDAPGVTTQLVGKGGGRDRDRGPRRDGERREGGRSDRPRGDGPRGDGPRSERPSRPAGAGGERAGRPSDRPGGRERGPREGAGQRVAADGGARSAGPRREGPRREGGRTETTDRSKGRRLNPAHTNRQAVVATLRPEEQAVAEQVLRGGLPAVRTALHLEREKATAEGRTPPDTEGLMALAEQLLPRLKAAEWRDRAEAAVKAGSDIALRDLRSVVAGADVAREEESRALATQLRAALEERVEAQRIEWTTDLGRHLDEGRAIRALQLSGRPPDPSTRLPAELAVRIAQVAGAAMTPEVTPERWMALLEAVAASPVRRSVQPAGLPAEPGADLLRAAHQQSGRVPALAAMLGVAMPPPPGPRLPPPPRSRRGAPRRPGGDAPAAPRPDADAPAAEAPSDEAAQTDEAAPAPEVAPDPEAQAAIGAAEASTTDDAEPIGEAATGPEDGSATVPDAVLDEMDAAANGPDPVPEAVEPDVVADLADMAETAEAGAPEPDGAGLPG